MPQPDGVRVPFTFAAHREVVVAVTVNGAGPFPFFLDTGSSHTSIASPLAGRLGAVAAAITTVRSVAGDEVCTVVRLDHVAIGPQRADAVLATEVAQQTLDPTGVVQGILGQDVLASSRYTVDFQKQQIDWTDAGVATGPQFTLRPSDGIFLVDLPQRDVTLSLVPDTGAEGLVLFRRDTPNLPRFVFAPGLSWMTTVTSRVAVRQVLLPELRIGPTEWVNQPAYLLDRRGLPESSGDGVLPLHLFARVTFDPPRQTIVFETSESN